MNLSSSSHGGSEDSCDEDSSNESNEEDEDSSVSTPNHANLDNRRGYVEEKSFTANQKTAVQVKLENIPLSGNERKPDKGRGRIRDNDFNPNNEEIIEIIDDSSEEDSSLRRLDRVPRKRSAQRQSPSCRSPS